MIVTSLWKEAADRNSKLNLEIEAGLKILLWHHLSIQGEQKEEREGKTEFQESK